MMDRFWIAVIVFSFISGIYTAVVVNLGREVQSSKGCTVAISRGNETHVVIGRESDL